MDRLFALATRLHTSLFPPADPMTASRHAPRALALPALALLMVAAPLAVPDAARAQTPVTTIENADDKVVLESYDDGALLAPDPDLSSDGAIPAEDAGVRMMWYSGKAAFRAGQVGGTQWNETNVGSESVAFGRNTTASGLRSTAMGDGTEASGGASTAMGKGTTASGDQSTAMGFSTIASGNQSTAMGLYTDARDSRSTAMGYDTEASGNASTAMGDNTTAGGDASTAMGNGTDASGNGSTAMGQATTASRSQSTAMGYETEASGTRSTAMGEGTTASGDQSTAMGDNTTASGNWSTAMGFRTRASGTRSTAMGFFTIASGERSTAMGDNTTASGNASTAMGRRTTASGRVSMAAGWRAAAESDSSFVWNDGSEYHAIPNASGGLSSDNAVVDEPVMGGKTFSVGAQGGVRFVTGPSSVTYIESGNAGWTQTSTRSAKTDVTRADPTAVLEAVEAMPISTWEYKTESGEGAGTRHIGPMAEDFHGALPYDLGSSEDHINSLNADGVALGAVKGLARKVNRQKETIATLKAENRDIKKRLAALEAEVSAAPATAGLMGTPAGSWGLALLLGLGGLAGGILWRRRL
jgi:hypothetical protein